MIAISNCPDSGLARKVIKKDLYILESARQVVLKCHVGYFDENGELIKRKGIQNYTVDLVASDSPVNPNTGQVLTPQQLANPDLGFTPITEFEFFAALKSSPVKVNDVENAYIAQRDLDGRFNI
jgi:hypothetical protein